MTVTLGMVKTSITAIASSQQAIDNLGSSLSKLRNQQVNLQLNPNSNSRDITKLNRQIGAVSTTLDGVEKRDLKIKGIDAAQKQIETPLKDNITRAKTLFKWVRLADAAEQKNSSPAVSNTTTQPKTNNALATTAIASAPFTQFDTAVKSLQITIGSILLPSVKSLLPTITGMANTTTTLFQKFPILSNVILHTVAAMTVLSITISKAFYLFNSYQMAILKVKNAIGIAKTAWQLFSQTTLIGTKIQQIYTSTLNFTRSALLRLGSVCTFANIKATALAATTRIMTAGQWLLNAALNANPIGLVITGIGLFIGGLVLLYQKCKPVRAFMSGFFDGFCRALAPLSAAFSPILDLFSQFGGIVDWIGDAFSGLLGWLGQFFSSLITNIKTLGEFCSSALAPLSTVFTPVLDLFSQFGGIVDWIGDAFSGLLGWLGQFFPLLTDNVETLSEFTSIGETVGYVIGSAFKIALAPISAVAKGVGWIAEMLGIIDDEKRIDFKVGDEVKTINDNIKPKFTTPDRAQQALSHSSKQINQQNQIAITVNNPTSNIDVEQTVTRAMFSGGILLSDKDY